MRVVFLALMLLGGPAAAFDLPFGKTPEPTAPAPRPVVSQIATDQTAGARGIPGTIRAPNEVMLGFQTLGRLIARPADLGDRVKAGDVLAELDPDDLTDSVRAAEAAVAAAEVAASTALTTAERVRELNRRGVAPQAQLEQAERALATADATLSQARSELIRARDAETFARLVAPFDGVVSLVLAEPGTVVQAGAPVVQLSGDDAREAVVDLPEATLAAIPDGAEFGVWLENASEIKSPARITRIEPLADAATRTRRVHLTLTGDTSGFRLGALVRAGMTASPTPVIVLPRSAILSRDGADYVWVVTRSDRTRGRVSLRPVTQRPASIAAESDVVILTGVTKGDEVVTRGVHSLKDGQIIAERLDR